MFDSPRARRAWADTRVLKDWPPKAFAALLTAVLVFAAKRQWGNREDAVTDLGWAVVTFVGAFVFSPIAEYGFRWLAIPKKIREERIADFEQRLGAYETALSRLPNVSARVLIEPPRVIVEVHNAGSVTTVWSSIELNSVFTFARPDMFAVWQGSNDSRIRLARGETKRLVIAKLDGDSGSKRWNTFAHSAEGWTDFTATKGEAHGDFVPIRVAGSVFCDPDSHSGPQPWVVWLDRLEARLDAVE